MKFSGRVRPKKLTQCTESFVFDTNGHSQELWLGPYMGSELDWFGFIFSIESRNWGMVTHLFGEKGDIGFGRPWNWSFFIFVGRRWVWFGTPETAEGFTQNWIIWLNIIFENIFIVLLYYLLGNRSVATGMEWGQVPFDNGNESITWCLPIWNIRIKIGMCKKIGIHFEQWSTLQNKCWQYH